jgi:membrane-bound ClpP family serine protease
VTELAPAGKVKVRGEYWDAIAQPGAPLEPGAKVLVVGIKGLQLAVKADSSGD